MRRRADVVLAERGLVDSRERAKAAILEGRVRIGGRVIVKAGEQIDPDALIEIEPMQQYVSRGGHKLEGAAEAFKLDVRDKRAVDVGASTGGFTDYLLQAGAAHVVAIDVGYGQLAWSLRQDPRVDVFERTNIRNVDPASVGAPFDLAVVDVSFISLRTVLDRVVALLDEQGLLCALVKPQFEAGKGNVGKKGVVRDSAVHVRVLEDTIAAIVEAGLKVRGLTWSPLRGPEGNIEFWVLAARTGVDELPDVHRVVAAAHQALGA